jgi:hypothetical protein
MQQITNVQSCFVLLIKVGVTLHEMEGITNEQRFQLP